MKCEYPDVQHNPSFVVEEGTSLYIPFGWTAAIIGLPSDTSVLQPQPRGRTGKQALKITDREVVVYAVSVCYDGAMDGTASDAVRSWVSGSRVSALTYVPASYRCSDAIKQWQENLLPKTTAGPSHDAL